MIKIEKDTKAWENIKKQSKLINDYETETGWFPENRYGSDNENLQMAQVAKWNNEGHALQGVPERPFMTVGFPRAIKSRKEIFQGVVQALVEGKNALVAMKVNERVLEDTLRQVMIDWDTPPNSPRTVEAKGFNDPLINTSQLVANVASKTVKKGSD